MKLISLAVAACLAIGIPCAAQTGTAQPPLPTDPVVIQALVRKLLAAGGSYHPILTPQQQADHDAAFKRLSQLEALGKDALHTGDFVAAEQFVREAINISDAPWLQYELAQSLSGQGRTADAIQVYRSVIYQKKQDDGTQATVAVSQNPNEMQSGMYLGECLSWEESEDWMRYALLLSQTGQQKEATKIYLKALPLTPLLGDQNKKTLSDTDHMSLSAFQAATHIAIGLCVSQTTGAEAAMREYVKAQQLQPDSPLTNYYYGYGWVSLGAVNQPKFASPDQAKAALEKAVTLGTGDVSAAAKVELSQVR